MSLHDRAHPDVPVLVHRIGRNGGAHRRRDELVTHPFAVVGLVTDGSATFEQRGRWELRPGDIHLVPAGEHHRLVQVHAEMLSVGFFPSAMACDADVIREPFDRVRRGGSAIVSLPSDRHEHVLSLFREVERAVGEPGRASAAVQRCLVTLIVAEVSRAERWRPDTDAPDDLVANALAVIERRCLGPLSLCDVAAEVNRSKAHVTTALKRATGRTVGGWILAGRLAEARRRLLHTDELVDVIAERVGYADATHFIRLFRREHGETPSAWRARQRAARASRGHGNAISRTPTSITGARDRARARG